VVHAAVDSFMKKKLQLLVIGITIASIGIGSIGIKCKNRTESQNYSGVAGGLISLRTACNNYLKDTGSLPLDLSEVKEYFFDEDAFVQNLSFYDRKNEEFVPFDYHKTGKRSFVIHTPWLRDGKSVFRYIATEEKNPIERETGSAAKLEVQN